MLTISRGQKWSRKNNRSMPTTVTINMTTQMATLAGFPHLVGLLPPSGVVRRVTGGEPDIVLPLGPEEFDPSRARPLDRS